MVFGIGDSGLKIQIDIQANPQSVINGTAIPIDHRPSWKVGKNPFLAGLTKMALLQKTKSNSNSNGNINSNNNSDANQDQGQNQNKQVNPPLQQQQMNNMNMHPQMQPMQPQYHTTQEILYIYGEHEDVQGVAHLTLPPGKKFEHLGIKIQFVGRVDMSQAIHDGRSHYDFISLTKELQPPSTLYQTQTSIPFYFRTEAKPYESYHGRNVHIRYFIRILAERKFFPAVKSDRDYLVQLIKAEPRLNEPIKMEVGIEECLHIEFMYKKRYYHLNDVIEGDIHFMLVRIKIKYMELAVIRRETCGDGVVNSNSIGNGNGNGNGSNDRPGMMNENGGSVATETQTLTRFEIMDGAPVKGEIIPVRLFLGGIPADLTPTYNSPNSRFAVKYYLNLVLVDEEDRRYFKQQEIILWRKQLG